MNRAVLLLLLLPLSASFGYDRVPVVDNSDEVEIRNTIDRVVAAFDQEDLFSYESCFRQSKRKAVRRQTAMVFANDDCHMELVDAHLIESDGQTASVAVKYRMGGASSSFHFLSELHMLKEEGGWVIDRESVRSSSGLRLAARGTPQKTPPNWDPYNPDPNLISPNLRELIGDIGIQPGFGCSGPNCAGGRCNK